MTFVLPKLYSQDTLDCSPKSSTLDTSRQSHIKCVQLRVLFTAIIDVRRECGVAVVGKLAASQGPRQPPRERINLHDNIHPRNRRQCGHTAPNNDMVCDRSSRSHRWFLASTPLVTTRPPSVVAGYKKRLFLFLDRFLGARSLRLRRHAASRETTTQSPDNPE